MRKPSAGKIIILALLGITVLFVLYLAWRARDQVSHRYQGDGLKVTVLSVASANISIVELDKKTLMIDSGNPGHEKRIEKLLVSEGYDPGGIDYLVLTHGHPDHVGTAKYFQSKYGVKTIGHVGDSELFSRGIRGELCPTSIFAKLLKFTSKDQAIEPFSVDIVIEEEFDLAQLGLRGKIIPLPGHTQGSVIIRMDQFAFVGDLVAGKPLAPGVAMTHFFMCDLAENKRHIEELLSWSDTTLWYPGHFGPLEPRAIRRYIESL
jgi:glyoxylase-like metal-dependent hydrolase (beta-lactamase superfamily II)